MHCITHSFCFLLFPLLCSYSSRNLSRWIFFLFFLFDDSQLNQVKMKEDKCWLGNTKQGKHQLRCGADVTINIIYIYVCIDVCSNGNKHSKQAQLVNKTTYSFGGDFSHTKRETHTERATKKNKSNGEERWESESDEHTVDCDSKMFGCDEGTSKHHSIGNPLGYCKSSTLSVVIGFCLSTF